jgi:hypothetical protein
MTIGEKLNARQDMIDALVKHLNGLPDHEGRPYTRRDVEDITLENWHALCHDTVVCMDVKFRLDKDAPQIFSIVGRFDFNTKRVVHATCLADDGSGIQQLIGE